MDTRTPGPQGPPSPPLPDAQTVPSPVVPGLAVEAVPAAAPEAAAAAAQALPADLVRQLQSGLSWFTWIAVLSVVNSLLVMTKAPISFPVGMGVTLVVAAVGGELSKGGSDVWNVVALVVTVGAAGCVYFVGRLARAGHRWAWVLGILAYGADALILLPFEDWIGVGFHVWALFHLHRGYKAMKQLGALGG